MFMKRELICSSYLETDSDSDPGFLFKIFNCRLRIFSKREESSFNDFVQNYVFLMKVSLCVKSEGRIGVYNSMPVKWVLLKILYD